MKEFPNIKSMVTSKDWKFLVKHSLPVNITDSYSFVEAMCIVDHVFGASVEEMIKDGFTSDLMRDYSVNLMTILRAKYPNEWKEDWKHEAYLGITCAFVYREEEAFKHIRNAYKQLDDPPQSLILAYISAGSGPDHFLTQSEISELSQKAIEKGVTYQSALRMAAMSQEKKEQYWTKKALEAEKNKIHTPFITPNILKGISNLKEGHTYED